MRKLVVSVQNEVHQFLGTNPRVVRRFILRTVSTCHGEEARTVVVEPATFYVQQLERKYSRPNRCC